MNLVSPVALLAGASPAATDVTNCADSGNGSLRAVLAAANDGDMVNIPLTCTLTLTSGELQPTATQLTVTGPASRFRIQQSTPNRIIAGIGSGGMLTLKNLELSGGQSLTDGGGCIATFGSLTLINSKVSGCSVTSPGDANGGAIYAHGTVRLQGSEVSGSTAYSQRGRVAGGGIWADAIVLTNDGATSSIVAQNKAIAASGMSKGGGLFASSNAYIAHSHVSGNEGGLGAGIFSNNICTIRSSVVSGNRNAQLAGGAYCHGSTIIVDSTITENEVAASVAPGGVFVYSGSIDLYNSIVALNRIPAGNAAVDLAANGRLMLNAAHNIVMNSNLTLPPDTLQINPQLDPQSVYPTASSPALRNGGANPLFSPEPDVNGTPRSVANMDIGAYQESVFNGDFQ